MINRKKWIVVSVTLLTSLVLMCAGCQKTTASSVVPSSTVGTETSALPNDSSSLPEESSSGTSSVDSSSDASSSNISSLESSSSAAGPAYKEADFKKAFDGNPIDKAYDSEINDAGTNYDMMKVAGKFVEIWETEVGIANKKAGQALSGSALNAYRADQKAWSDKKEAALNKLQKDIQDEGGSNAALELSMQTADFYRSRVYKIYLAVYLETGKPPKLSYNGENE